MELFGIKFMGVNAVTGQALLLTLSLVAAVVLRLVFNGLSRSLLRGRENEHLRFWTQRHALQIGDINPKVCYRSTDNWLVTVRFLTNAHSVREVKAALSRDILKELEAANIGLASATYDIVGFPKVQVAVERSNA